MCINEEKLELSGGLNHAGKKQENQVYIVTVECNWSDDHPPSTVTAAGVISVYMYVCTTTVQLHY